jgi:hypothetical protein
VSLRCTFMCSVPLPHAHTHTLTRRGHESLHSHTARADHNTTRADRNITRADLITAYYLKYRTRSADYGYPGGQQTVEQAYLSEHVPTKIRTEVTVRCHGSDFCRHRPARCCSVLGLVCILYHSSCVVCGFAFDLLSSSTEAVRVLAGAPSLLSGNHRPRWARVQCSALLAGR